MTNGLGGFASGTVAGVPTRRYHGLLVAALPTPLGRTVMLNHLSEWLRARRRHALRDRRPGARRRRARMARREAPASSSGSTMACPSGATSWAATSSRSACACSTAKHRPHHVPPRPRAKRRPAQAAPRAPRPAARGVRPRGDREPYTITADRGPTRGGHDARIPAAAPQDLRPARDVRARQRQDRERPLQRRGRARLRRRGRAVEPRLLERGRERGDETATLVGSTEAWDTIARALARGGARPRSASGASACSPRPRPAARCRRRRRARPRRRPVRHHAVGPPGGRRARARRGRERCARSSPAITGSPTGAATR